MVGCLNMILFKFTTTSVSEKKFENWLIFGEVIGNSLVSCFFDSQCRHGFVIILNVAVMSWIHLVSRNIQVTSVQYFSVSLFGCWNVFCVVAWVLRHFAQVGQRPRFFEVLGCFVLWYLHLNLQCQLWCFPRSHLLRHCVCRLVYFTLM